MLDIQVIGIVGAQALACMGSQKMQAKACAPKK